MKDSTAIIRKYLLALHVHTLANKKYIAEYLIDFYNCTYMIAFFTGYIWLQKLFFVCIIETFTYNKLLKLSAILEK